MTGGGRTARDAEGCRKSACLAGCPGPRRARLPSSISASAPRIHSGCAAQNVCTSCSCPNRAEKSENSGYDGIARREGQGERYIRLLAPAESTVPASPRPCRVHGRRKPVSATHRTGLAHAAPLWSRSNPRCPGSLPNEPRRRRSTSLNIELQAALNPAGERKVERFGWTFAPGDKVMQIENDYDKEVYNGDIGFVARVEPEEGELTASFDGRSVTYGFGELDALVPAYAASVHKSQGSEYSAVVIPVMTQHYAMLQRNFSTPASPEASGWSCWSGRRRPSPSRCATPRAGGGGRS